MFFGCVEDVTARGIVKLNIVAVVLTCNRRTLAERAIRSLRVQTSHLSKVILFDSGAFTVYSPFSDALLHAEGAEHTKGLSVGALRNLANAIAVEKYQADIIVHADDDDWSHPNRIAEQVALLQSSGKQCVGYRDMLFWEEQRQAEFISKTPREQTSLSREEQEAQVYGRAWLYSNNDPRYCLGTSLCYWRETWERRPFPDLPKKKGGPAEDVEWLREVDSLGVNVCPSTEFSPSPRMIASIHGGNTQYYNPAEYVARQLGTSWKRAAEWDEYARKVMTL